MRLLEVTGTEAIELLADLIDPITDIAQDADILKCIQTNQKIKAVKFALKNHAQTVIEIMALCEGVPVDEYNPYITELPGKILEILNHPDIAKLFTSQVQTEAPSSGLATENTQAQ